MNADGSVLVFLLRRFKLYKLNNNELKKNRMKWNEKHAMKIRKRFVLSFYKLMSLGSKSHQLFMARLGELKVSDDGQQKGITVKDDQDRNSHGCCHSPILLKVFQVEFSQDSKIFCMLFLPLCGRSQGRGAFF